MKLIRHNLGWSRRTLAGFDTETTGVDPETARIVSASIVIDTPDSEPVIYEWLIDPGVEIELQATAIHGISTEEARRKGLPAEVGIGQIIKTLKSIDCPIVLVNAPFDLTILDREARRYGFHSPDWMRNKHIIDTLTCDRMIDTYRPGRRTLTAVAAAYGIAIAGAHTSTGDVICAIKLARAIARKYPWFATCNLDYLQRLQANAHIEWADNFENFRRMNDPRFIVSREWPYRTYEHMSDCQN